MADEYEAEKPVLRHYCEEIEIVASIRTVNEKGQAVAVRQTKPMLLLRAVTPDVWGHLDAELMKSLSKERG